MFRHWIHYRIQCSTLGWNFFRRNGLDCEKWFIWLLLEHSISNRNILTVSKCISCCVAPFRFSAGKPWIMIIIGFLHAPNSRLRWRNFANVLGAYMCWWRNSSTKTECFFYHTGGFIVVFFLLVREKCWFHGNIRKRSIPQSKKKLYAIC